LGLAALVVAYLFFGWPVLLVGVPASTPAGIRTEVDADAVPTVRPAAVDTRQSVTTTPPALPSPSDVPGDTASRTGSIRAGSSFDSEGPRTAMTPPVPPRPAVPVL
jgi:hypothetical protein